MIVMMGVSGSGKTTVGSLLAQELHWNFADADDYHSPANIEKMRRGIPLTDADRAPWLDSLRSLIGSWVSAGKNGVLACSALKQAYREELKGGQVSFVYLKASREVLTQRLLERRNHYMKESMLTSQLAALQEPTQAIVVNAEDTPEQLVHEIRQALQLES